MSSTASSPSCSKQYPNVRLTKIDDAVAYTRGNYTSAHGDAARRRRARRARRARSSCATCARRLIAAIALPLSAIPTFWAMSLMGFSLNLVSLLGITLVTGILVDDAIVEIENIVRHMRIGKSPYRAVDRGRRRDRPRRHRHLADHRRDLLARLVHGRHRRPVLQAVRPDRRRRRAVLAARRPPHHADDGRLPDASRAGEDGRRRLRHARLRRLLASHAAGCAI